MTEHLVSNPYRSDDVVSALEDFFDEQDENFFGNGIQPP